MAWVPFPLQRLEASEFFNNADTSVTDFLPHAETGTLRTEARDRLDAAEVSRTEYDLHIMAQATPHTETPHTYHEAVDSCLLGRLDLDSALLCTTLPGV